MNTLETKNSGRCGNRTRVAWMEIERLNRLAKLPLDILLYMSYNNLLQF